MKLNVTEVIGEGIYPDEERVVAIYNTDGKADAPIRIQNGAVNGLLKPNTATVMPACVAQMLVESSYNVAVLGAALVNEEADDVPEIVAHSGLFETIKHGSITPGKLSPEDAAALDAAVRELEASRAKAAELVKLKVDDLKPALAGLDLNTLRFLLEAEESEGPGKTRVTAVEAVEAAIDAHPDQIAALAAAAEQIPPANEDGAQTS